MKHFFILLLALTSTQLVVGQGQKITYSELGLSFVIPDGWSGQIDDDYYILGHHTIPGIMILFENTSTSAEELIREAQQGIREEGVVLQPTNDFVTKGNERVEGFYEGNVEGQAVKAFAVGLINSKGSGINTLILTETAVFSDQHISEVKKLTNSVKFFDIKFAESTLQWGDYLIGKKLVKSNSSGSGININGHSSINDKRSIYLYNNGTFEYQFYSHSSFDVDAGFGYVNSSDDSSGTFNIQTLGNETYLILMFDDGRIYEYVLTQTSEGHTHLNGRRYLVVGHDE
ncbi:MAG: hypothetical protein KTR13_00815 [Saprospiraceae bacterium]|nr:hypothetical protein [Saprospiraceae bacterium]